MILIGKNKEQAKEWLGKQHRSGRLISLYTPTSPYSYYEYLGQKYVMDTDWRFYHFLFPVRDNKQQREYEELFL